MFSKQYEVKVIKKKNKLMWQIAVYIAVAVIASSFLATSVYRLADFNRLECWQVRRPDEDSEPLGNWVEVVPDKGVGDKESVVFNFTLPISEEWKNAQIDQMADERCLKALPMVSSKGRVEFRIRHDTGSDPTDDIKLLAEPFFKPINMQDANGNKLDWLYGPSVELKPDNWTRICWDRNNSPIGFGREDWVSGQLQTVGIEIKSANGLAPTELYTGTVYISDFQIIDDGGCQ